MTTYNELKAEIERQSARLLFTTDPTNQMILKSSIVDLVKALGKYPTGLVWLAGPKGDRP